MKQLWIILLMALFVTNSFAADSPASVMAYKDSGRLSSPTNLFYTNLVAGTNIIFERIGSGRLKIHGTGGGGSQTPWLSDINAASFQLTNLNAILFSGLTNALFRGPNGADLVYTNGSANVAFRVQGSQGDAVLSANGGGHAMVQSSPLKKIYLDPGGLAGNAIYEFDTNYFRPTISNGVDSATALTPWRTNYSDAVRFQDGTVQITAATGSSLFQMGTSNATHIPILWGANLVQLIQGSNTVLYTVATGIVINAVSAADFISSVDPVYFQVSAAQLNLTNAHLVDWAKYDTNVWNSRQGGSATLTNLTTTGAVTNISVSGDLSISGNNTNVTISTLLTNSVGVTVDGAGSVISTGQKGFIQIPYTGVIRGATLMADQNGSVVFDVWRTNSTGFPPTVSGTITASAKPTLTSTNWSTTTLTSWITNVTAGDFIGWNVDSATSCTRVTLQLAISH